MHLFQSRLAGQQLGDHDSGDAGQQHAVAAVTGGVSEPFDIWLWSHDGETIGGAGP